MGILFRFVVSWMLDWFDIVPMLQLISLASLGFDLKVDFIFLLVQKNEAKKARP